MKLYIHFGIYKAGSSYLQYILANSKDFLIGNGVYFPGSWQDKKMQMGFISAGNADGLEDALKTRNKSKCIRILKDWLKKAETQQCGIVLISAESLVHQLVIPEVIQILQDSAKDVGYKEIHAMGFFRDLADHALSTYKHRGKSGKIPDFDNWLANYYETPILFENLCKIRSGKNDIIWTFRKFQKDSNFMKLAFFGWLKIPVPGFEGKQQVNESVTLSEVCLMTEVAKMYPFVTDYFAERLKMLAFNKKANDAPLNNYFYVKAVDLLGKYKNIIDALNKYLPSNEQLIIGKPPGPEEKVNRHMVFTQPQLHSIFSEIQFFRSKKGKLILMRRKFKAFLPKKLVKLVGYNDLLKK